MDFNSLISAASRNAKNGAESNKYYSTRFEPPKKVTKEKKLSDGIRKFLQKKESEEREKEEARKKEYERLQAMRSDKDKNKIRKMLKVTKSANRSVIADAVSSTDTAVTMQGPEQPDEDDYGYTSHEASALYKNLMDKYKSIPEDKKFTDTQRRNKNGDLLTTKDRVRAAIEKDKEDEHLGRKRLTTSNTSGSSSSAHHSESEQRHRSRKNLYDPKAEREEEERRKKEEEEERRRKIRAKRPPPPVMDFNKLLELAKEKQHEPIQIEVQPQKPKEPERLLTAKEKREIEMRKAQLSGSMKKDGSAIKSQGDNRSQMSNGRIPKLPGAIPKQSNTASTQPTDNRKMNGIGISRDSIKTKPSNPSSSSILNKALTKPQFNPISSRLPPAKQSSSQPSHDRRPIDPKSRSNEPIQRNVPKQQTLSKSSKDKPLDSKSVKPREFPPRDSAKPRDFPPKDVVRSRDFPPKDIAKSRDFPPKDVVKSREFPPKDVARSREFPPKDVVRSREFPPKDIMKSREFPPRDIQRNGAAMKKKQQMMAQKRRILDDSDSEYDSEMDDFIDDDTEFDDYSKHIKEIFGYDKSRFRDEDDDVDNMESNFAQQQREEWQSKKIGLMEDLEDMRLEAEEKKRKAKRRRV